LRQLVPVRQLQFAQYRSGVCFHGAGGDREPGADFFVGVSGDDEAQHVLFASGELVEFRVQPGWAGAAEGVEHEAGQAGEK
jgi:hypothetical protein